jgi:hypothetical protein
MSSEFGSPVQPVREHKKVTDEIDDLYMDAVYAASRLQSYLVQPRGVNRMEQFMLFYRSFYGLFLHTRVMQGDDKGSEIVDCDDWFDSCANRRTLPVSLMRRGIVLFKIYQEKIVKAGIVTTRR